MEKKMFNTRETAEYLCLTKAALEAWRCHGGGPVFVKLGKSVRYRKGDLDAFVKANLHTNTSGY